MKIIGTGVDIVENSRIKRSILNNSFLNRIFTNKEIQFSKKMKNKSSYFAKRFAAKEAFVKSLGTGFRDGFNFKDIEPMSSERFHLEAEATKIAFEIKDKTFRLFESISRGIRA